MNEHHDPRVIAMTGVKPTENQINLAGELGYAHKLNEMKALLLDEMRRLDDPYRFWNQPSDGLPLPILKEKIKNLTKKKTK